MIKEKYMRFIILNLFFVIIFSIPNLGYAYIGPGLGAGTIGIVIGIIASIFLALFAIFWYPIKRLLKRKKANSEEESPKP